MSKDELDADDAYMKYEEDRKDFYDEEEEREKFDIYARPPFGTVEGDKEQVKETVIARGELDFDVNEGPIINNKPLYDIITERHKGKTIEIVIREVEDE